MSKTLPGSLASSATFGATQTATALRRAAELACSAHELTLREYWLLLLAAPADSSDALSQGEIGDLLGIDRSDMVRLVDIMENRDLIARQRDTADRRRQLITPTATGLQVRSATEADVTSAENEALQGLSQKQSEKFRTLAAKAIATGSKSKGSKKKNGKGKNKK